MVDAKGEEHIVVGKDYKWPKKVRSTVFWSASSARESATSGLVLPMSDVMAALTVHLRILLFALTGCMTEASLWYEGRRGPSCLAARGKTARRNLAASPC